MGAVISYRHIPLAHLPVPHAQALSMIHTQRTEGQLEPQTGTESHTKTQIQRLQFMLYLQPTVIVLLTLTRLKVNWGLVINYSLQIFTTTGGGGGWIWKLRFSLCWTRRVGINSAEGVGGMWLCLLVFEVLSAYVKPVIFIVISVSFFISLLRGGESGVLRVTRRRKVVLMPQV